MLSLFRQKPGFYRRLIVLTLPMVLQNLITTSLGFVDTFMVGSLGNAPMAAVTAANTPIFVLQVMSFGLMSGLTVLVSQFWGRGDRTAINRCLGVCMYLCLAISLTAGGLLLFFPRQVLGLLTDNPVLIDLGAPYLRIVGPSYLFDGLASVYVGLQRSVENPRFGMRVYALAVVLNTCLNYVLIFGHFGAPALGITGAAAATLTSRIVELAVVLAYALRSRRMPLEFSALFCPGMEMLRRFIHYSVPVLINETLWGVGTSLMTVIMGHMAISTEMLAAYAIMGNIDRLSTVACFGLAGATAVIVGKAIGEGQSTDSVYDLARVLLTAAVLVGLSVSLLLAVLLPTFFLPTLYPLFHLSPMATEIAFTMAVIYCCTTPMRAFDISNITGVLRAGGDAKVASVIDLSTLWLFAIPLTALCALVLDAPVTLVCLAIQGENFVKMPMGLARFRSRKWINDVTKEAV